MSFQIQIQGTDYLFESHGSESLLESALNAGVPVNYGCSNGNCGDCAASLVSGEVSKFRNSDYVFCTADHEAGRFLLCTHQPKSDLVIDALTATHTQDIPEQRIAVKVKKVRPINAEIALLDVQTPRTQRLRFLAGQWARLEHNSGCHCELPIASCPCDDRNIQFHVPVQGAYCDTAQAMLNHGRGQTLTLIGPHGDFVLDHSHNRPRVMVGTGFGFPPLKSIMEHSLALNPDTPIDLLWLEAPGRHHYMENHMRMWNDALDNVSLHRIECQALNGEQPSQALIQRVQTLAQQDVDMYIAGPRELSDFVLEVIHACGVAPDHVHSCVV